MSAKWLLNEDKGIELIALTLGSDDEDDKYYVYTLCKNDVPFYVGKGCGKRVWEHQKNVYEYLSADNSQKSLKELCDETDISDKNNIKRKIQKKIDFENEADYKENKEQRNFDSANAKDKISEKFYEIIKSIKEETFTKKIIKWGLDEKESFMLESGLINLLGMDNLTNVVNGHMSKREKANNECTTAMYKIIDFPIENTCCITDIKEPAMFVNIKDTYLECKDEKDVERAIYDCARCAWTMEEKRVRETKVVFAMYRSKIVGVYRNLKFIRRGEISISDFPTCPDENRKNEWKIKEFFSKSKEQALRSLDDKDDITFNISNDELEKNFEKLKSEFNKKYCFISTDRSEDDFKNKIIEVPYYHNDGDYEYKKLSFGQNSVLYNYEVKKAKLIIFDKDYYVSRNKKNLEERIKNNLDKYYKEKTDKYLKYAEELLEELSKKFPQNKKKKEFEERIIRFNNLSEE